MMADIKTWAIALGVVCAIALSGCATAGRSADNPSCQASGVVQFRHLSDLPPDAVAVVAPGGLPMSDAGGPFQASDAIIEGGGPITRFIEGEQTGCHLVIRYEQGGRGYHRDQILLRRTAKTWEVEEGTSYPYSTLIAAGPGAVAGDSLNDARLMDFAAKLFSGDPSIVPPYGGQLGTHHGFPVLVSGLPCRDCGFQTVALYYTVPARDPRCREIGGLPMLYPHGFLAASGELGRFCVPGVLVRAGVVGAGKPDDGREKVEGRGGTIRDITF